MSRTLAELTEDFERVSQVYARHVNIDRDADWFILKLQEEVGELVHAYLRLTGRSRDNGETAEAIRKRFEDEAADVLGQLLTLARHHRIDLESAAQGKWFCHLPG